MLIQIPQDRLREMQNVDQHLSMQLACNKVKRFSCGGCMSHAGIMEGGGGGGRGGEKRR